MRYRVFMDPAAREKAWVIELADDNKVRYEAKDVKINVPSQTCTEIPHNESARGWLIVEGNLTFNDNGECQVNS